MLGFTLTCKDGESHAQNRDNVVICLLNNRDNVVIYLSIVISTVTKLIIAITTQRQTHQDLLDERVPVNKNPFVTQN